MKTKFNELEPLGAEEWCYDDLHGKALKGAKHGVELCHREVLDVFGINIIAGNEPVLQAWILNGYFPFRLRDLLLSPEEYGRSGKYESEEFDSNQVMSDYSLFLRQCADEIDAKVKAASIND
jgi:hypothetical protein